MTLSPRSMGSMTAGLLAVFACSPFLVGCDTGDAPSPQAAANPQADTGEMSSVTVALSAVPTSMLCIRITATPTTGTAVSTTFAPAVGSSTAALKVGPLVAGSYTFTADAFNVVCDSITDKVADWIADPVSATVQYGVTTNVALTFRKNNPVNVNANFVNNVKIVATGTFGTFVVQEGSFLSSTQSTNRVFVRSTASQLSTGLVVSIAVGYTAVCVARTDGTVWCWGSSQYGQLGPGVAVGGSSTIPVQVPGLTGVVQVAAGYGHMCALGASGSVSCWGYNGSGQLGRGTLTDSSTPTAVSERGKAIAASFYTT